MAKEKVIHFVLSLEDGDLIGWLRSLPKRSFNKTVNRILVSESYGDVAPLPCTFSSAEVAEEVQCRIVLRDEKAERFVSSIPYGEVTGRLKEILRRHIKANQTRPKEIDVRQLFRLFQNFRTKMMELEEEAYGVPDRDRLLCVFYDQALQRLFSSVSSCYQTGDQISSDARLAKLQDENFPKEIFEQIFADELQNAENFGQEE
ncbi:MAG: hypothetical protein IJE78_11985 [Bacteroidaceae bacterium]|nr:hypothetical protein [Bacteroidaceae bacterium]